MRGEPAVNEDTPGSNVPWAALKEKLKLGNYLVGRSRDDLAQQC